MIANVPLQINNDQLVEVFTPNITTQVLTSPQFEMTTPMPPVPTTPASIPVPFPQQFSTPTDGIRKGIWDILKVNDLPMDLHQFILNVLSDTSTTRPLLALNLANRLFTKDELINTWYDKPTQEHPQKMLDQKRITGIQEICFHVFPSDEKEKCWAACMAKITTRCRTLRSRKKKADKPPMTNNTA